MRLFAGIFLLLFAVVSDAQHFERLQGIQLSNLKDKPAYLVSKKDLTVVIFLGTDCPISQKYMNRIEELKKKYNASTTFFGVIPMQFSIQEMRAFKKEYKSSITYLRDGKMELAGYLGAKVTPEVFLFKDSHLVYHGAIDNWFYELGKYRRNITEQYLIDAIESTLKGEQPAIKETEAIGCFIQMPNHSEHMDHH